MDRNENGKGRGNSYNEMEGKDLQCNTSRNGCEEEQIGDEEVERFILISTTAGLICIMITTLYENGGRNNTSVSSIFCKKYSWKEKDISTRAIAWRIR